MFAHKISIMGFIEYRNFIRKGVIRMVAKVVGVQSVDFTDKDGKPVQGAKVHFIRDIVPDESAYIVGQVADTLFIRADSPLISTVKGFKLGAQYDFLYECLGRRKTSLVDIKAIA